MQSNAISRVLPASPTRREPNRIVWRVGLGLSWLLLLTACPQPAGPSKKGDRTVVPETTNQFPRIHRLNQADAIRLAQQGAQRESIRLREYKSPKVTFKVRRELPTWVVHFERDVEYQYPGSCFDVFIDDRTGSTDLVRCE